MRSAHLWRDVLDRVRYSMLDITEFKEIESDMQPELGANLAFFRIVFFLNWHG